MMKSEEELKRELELEKMKIRWIMYYIFGQNSEIINNQGMDYLSNKNCISIFEMKYRFEIDKRLMGLNEYTRLNRENKYKGNQAKQREQAYIMWCIKEQLGDLKLDKPVIGHFTWIEENKRRDLDNICFAKKFILDALVNAGVLADDNRKIVTNFTDSFGYSNKSRVIVELEET